MRSKARNLWPVIAIFMIAGAVIWWLYTVGHSPHRSDLATYGAFAVGLVGLALIPIGWIWRIRTRPANRAAEGQELEHLTDHLAVAVTDQWTRAASERGLLVPEPILVRWRKPSLPLTGSAAAATGSKRFAPLPGLPAIGEASLMAGDIKDLHAVYGGLGSGRLVIAGPAGAGKSGAAVLLVLDALRHREQAAQADRPEIPVPVLFTAQEWDPVNQRVHDWLVLRLQETYPMFTGKAGAANAAALVTRKKITVILDGLDEIAKDLRPAALQALSQQTTFRLIVLARSAEMAHAAPRRGVLEGAAAIELQAIDPETIADYLRRIQLDPPPDGWRDLTARVLAPESLLARALDSPLTLTLIRDTYRAEDDIHELLDFCDTARRKIARRSQGRKRGRSRGRGGDGDSLTKAITDHLLGRLLPAVYTRRPGEKIPPYDLQTAQNALTVIAARMDQDDIRDLQWWRLPGWAPAMPRIIGPGLAIGLLTGLGFWLLGTPWWWWLQLGLLLAFITAGRRALTLISSTPQRINLRPRAALSLKNLGFWLIFGLVSGLLSGAGAGFVAGLKLGFRTGMGAGLSLGLALGITLGVGYALQNAVGDRDSTSSLSPLSSWRSNRRFGLLVGLVSGLVSSIGAGLVYSLRLGLNSGIKIGLVVGILIGLTGGLNSSETWLTSLASVQLAGRWHTPVNLLRFLDDARERSILRAVGPVYQFRHARLQDHLARQDHSHQHQIPR